MNQWNFFFLFFAGFISTQNAIAQNRPSECTGDNEMLSLVNRPSASISTCTIPEKTLFIESGYTYFDLIPEGHGYNYPQSTLRFGLPYNTELLYYSPSYTKQFPENISGFGPTSVGLKHILYFDSHQLVTLQGVITPPSGNLYYGTRKTEFFIDGIYSYNFDSGANVTTTLEISAISPPPVEDINPLFYSFDPVINLSLPVGKALISYVEVYAETKTALDEGWGVNLDTGIIGLVHKHITIDLFYGQRISGAINNISRYVGAGLVLYLT